MADKTLDLFSRPIKKDSEVHPDPTEHPACVERPGSDLDDPRVQQMVGNAFASFYNVDDWVDSKTAPVTFELDSQSGKFYMTKSKKEHKRLVADGEVVFSPLEVEKFIHYPDGTLADFIYAMRADIYAIKKMDPASKVVNDELHRLSDDEYRKVEAENPELLKEPEACDEQG